MTERQKAILLLLGWTHDQESRTAADPEWFSDNRTRARIYAWTAAFMALGLGIFGGQVSTLLPNPHRYIFLPEYSDSPSRHKSRLGFGRGWHFAPMV
jgi:hypothetical protein